MSAASSSRSMQVCSRLLVAGLYKRSGLVVPDVRVEELPPHKALRLIRAELGVINGVLPIARDRRDHVVDDLLSLLCRELEFHSSLAAQPELAVSFPGPGECDGVSGSLPRSRLRGEIEGRGQAQALPVPERGVVAQVVVGVSDADVEHEPGEELPQRCRNVLPRSLSNSVGELGVGGVSSFRFMYAEDCESGEHLPALSGGAAVEALQKKYFLARNRADLRARDLDTNTRSKESGGGFGLDDGPGVGSRGKFRDELPLPINQERLWSGTADGGAMAGGGLQLSGQRRAGLDEFSRV